MAEFGKEYKDYLLNSLGSNNSNVARWRGMSWDLIMKELEAESAAKIIDRVLLLKMVEEAVDRNMSKFIDKISKHAKT